jgi:PEP-CTERM motif
MKYQRSLLAIVRRRNVSHHKPLVLLLLALALGAHAVADDLGLRSAEPNPASQTVSLALATGAGVVAPNDGASIVGVLGAAGPDHFALLSLGSPSSSTLLVNMNLATVDGTIGIANSGKFQESAPSVVNGQVIVGSSVNTSGAKGVITGGISVNDALLSPAVAAANSAATYFAALPVTPSVQSQFPSNGQITGNLTVTGTPGWNVVNLSSFTLNTSGALTLSGPPGTEFVINVSGNFLMQKGTIAVAGGIGPDDVVFNITNSSASVKTMVPTTGVGIILAPDNAINSLDSTTFTGELIGGYDNTITLMSGTKLIQPPPSSQVPEPSVFLLSGAGLLAIATLLRKHTRRSTR